MEKFKQRPVDNEGLLNKDLKNIGTSEIRQKQEAGISRRSFLKKTLLGAGAIALGSYGIKEIMKEPDNLKRFKSTFNQLNAVEAELEELITAYSGETQDDETLEAVARAKIDKCHEAKLDISIIRQKMMNLDAKPEKSDVEELKENFAKLSEALQEIGIDISKFANENNPSVPNIINNNFTLDI